MGDNTTVWARPARSDRENRERAYAAAARRTERGIQARIESALQASWIHYERTGRCYYLTPEIVEGDTSFEDLEDYDQFADRALILPSNLNHRTLWEERCQALRVSLFPYPPAPNQGTGNRNHMEAQMEAENPAPVAPEYTLQATQGSHLTLNSFSNGILGGASFAVPIQSDAAWISNGTLGFTNEHFGLAYPTFDASSSDSNRSVISPQQLGGYAPPTLAPTEAVNGITSTTTITSTPASPARSNEIRIEDWLCSDYEELEEEESNSNNIEETSNTEE